MKKNIASLKLQFFILIAFFLFPSCIHRKQIDKQKLIIKTAPQIPQHHSFSAAPPITIWVHGTLMFRKPSYHLIFGDTSSLVPVISLPKDNRFQILANSIAEHDAQQFPLEEFYIFSWSGRLPNQERKSAANKLYQEINALCELYRKKYGCEPTIRIITHSHGGNVALNMAKIKTNAPPFSIKSLVLLACPVQEKTKHLMVNPMFQRVYSLYSSLDMIQVIAPQIKRNCTTHCLNEKHKRHYRIPPFSSRLFPTYSHLTQAKIKINDFPISHTRFSTPEFAALLPTILEKLDSWHAQSLAGNTIAKYKLLCIYKPKKHC